MIEVVQMSGHWFVLVYATGVMHGPYPTRKIAQDVSDRLAGRCKDCSA